MVRPRRDGLVAALPLERLLSQWLCMSLCPTNTWAHTTTWLGVTRTRTTLAGKAWSDRDQLSQGQLGGIITKIALGTASRQGPLHQLLRKGQPVLMLWCYLELEYSMSSLPHVTLQAHCVPKN